MKSSDVALYFYDFYNLIRDDCFRSVGMSIFYIFIHSMTTTIMLLDTCIIYLLLFECILLSQT